MLLSRLQRRISSVWLLPTPPACFPDTSVVRPINSRSNTPFCFYLPWTMAVMWKCFPSCLALFLCTAAGNMVIPKCCPSGQQFNRALKCETSDSVPDNWDWILNTAVLPDGQTVNSTESPTVMANTTLNCPHDSRAFLVHEMSDFRMIVTQSGRLHLEVLVDSLRNEEQAANYTESFCMDAKTRIITFCPCMKVPCLRKCCHHGHAYNVSLGKCVDMEDDDRGFWQPNFEYGAAQEGYYILSNMIPTCEARTASVVQASNDTRFTVLADGSVQVSGYSQSVPSQKYCGDAGMLLVCPGQLRRSNTKYLVYGGLLVLAGVLLLASVYTTACLLPRTVSSYFHTTHNAVMAVAYVGTGIAQLLHQKKDLACVSLAFIIQFAFLAAFFWLNVMCIDIAWAFSGLRPPQGSALERDHKKFILYSVYAWGTAGLISVFTAVVEFVPGLADDSPFKPNFGRRSCWFEKPAATLAYFYGPMAFLILANLILFLYTAARIISVRRDTAILNSAGNTSGSATNKEKQRLVLYVKLFCLMGLTWITEIISWAVGGADYYWYITDVVNMLRAVFIFVIFCCKRSVLNLLRARLPCSGVKRIMHSKSGTSFSVPTSSLKLTTSFKMSTRRLSQET